RPPDEAVRARRTGEAAVESGTNVDPHSVRRIPSRRCAGYLCVLDENMRALSKSTTQLQLKGVHLCCGVTLTRSPRQRRACRASPSSVTCGERTRRPRYQGRGHGAGLHGETDNQHLTMQLLILFLLKR